MKNSLENTIKQSIEGYELPYNASAWTALSQKLDVIKPVSPSPKGGAGKWIAAAGIVTALSVGAYVYFGNNNDAKNETNTSQTELVTEKNDNTINITQNENQTAEKVVSSNDNKETIGENVKAKSALEFKETKTNLDNEGLEDSKTKSATPTNNGIQKSGAPSNENITNVPKQKAIKTPSTRDLCLGDALNIKNENDSDLTLILPNGKSQVIRKSTSLNTKSTISGEYHILSSGNEIASFKVNKLPNLDFTMDEQLIAEEGVPTVPVATYSEGSNYVWTAEGVNAKMYGKNQNIHFFKKGTHTITLQAENSKGCVGEVSKTIKIEEDYNLFAPNAVNPWSTDRRKNRFIPRALNVRDVQFTMLIVDAKTGVTVYMTTDANEGWDGMDKNTGEMVPVGSVYAWKVHLNNPLPGESYDYKGTVEVANH